MKKISKLSDFESIMLWSAARYFLGRQTIASACFPADVIENWHHRLHKTDKELLVRDITEHFERHGSIGHREIDQPHWLKFASALDEDAHEDINLTDGSTCRVFRANGKVYPLEYYLRSPSIEIYVPEENIEGT